MRNIIGHFKKIFCNSISEPVAFPETSPKPIIEWIDIPAGTFLMGSPRNEIHRHPGEFQHKIKLSAFKMSKYAISFQQYDFYCESTGKEKPGDSGWGRDTRPVINVSWYEALEFASWMNCQLPTEAEWEYACRAGTTSPFNTGENLFASQANYNGHYPYNNNAKGIFRGKTTPVGNFTSNAWGLCDMHGNVYEWCHDFNGAYEEFPKKNPTGPRYGDLRVCRGGDWHFFALYCRSACRAYNKPEHKDDNIGFRLVQH
jgi:sulfatase modifying factor 1